MMAGARILMPLLGTNPDLTTLPVFDCLLANFDYDTLLTFIDAFPAFLCIIHEWGLGSPGPWQDQIFQCTHHREVIDFHSQRQGVSDISLSIDPTTRDINLSDSEFPITHWVQTNRLDFLRRLHAEGFWEPLGWTLDGYSYFKLALDHNAVDVITYIARRAEGNTTFYTSEATVPAVTGLPQIMRTTHLDVALEAGLGNTFWSWWTSIQPRPDAKLLLNRTSRRLLCEISTYQQAQDLYTKHNIDISSSIRRIGNLVPAGYPFPDGPGTPWHLAVRNPNIDFIDFLLNRIPAQIDWLQGETRSPLVQALEEGKHEHFERLLCCTADPRVATTRILSTIPHWNDRWFISLQPWIRYPIPEGQGSALHTIVEGLKAGLERIEQDGEALTTRQKGNLKKQKIKRAERLIAHVRHGNVYGQPSLGLTDRSGNTAHELAEMYGLHWIYTSLNPRPKRLR